MSFLQEAHPINSHFETPCRVLLVDDNVELLSSVHDLMTVSGFEVVSVCSVLNAFESLFKQVPDIIVCDVMLPDKSGFDFHKELKEHPIWCLIPFIFISGLSASKDVRLGKLDGCDDYIVKPFDPEDLLAVVHGKLLLSKNRGKIAKEEMETFRKRIIHTLSHEFRTPLVSVNTGAELLLDQIENLEKKQIRRLLESILRGGQRLEKLVEDFMLLQQIDLGHAKYTCELYRAPFSLIHIAETAIECFCDCLTEIGGLYPIFLVEEEIKKKPIKVNVYDVQIINIIQRLLSNAYKFAGAENVVVSVGKKDSYGYVSIRDFGPGISNFSESVEKLMQPFVQVNREIQEQQGCGLGLCISNYFAQINGASLELRCPNDGIGVEALISLPVI